MLNYSDTCIKKKMKWKTKFQEKASDFVLIWRALMVYTLSKDLSAMTNDLILDYKNNIPNN